MVAIDSEKSKNEIKPTNGNSIVLPIIILMFPISVSFINLFIATEQNIKFASIISSILVTWILIIADQSNVSYINLDAKKDNAWLFWNLNISAWFILFPDLGYILHFQRRKSFVFPDFFNYALSVRLFSWLLPLVFSYSLSGDLFGQTNQLPNCGSAEVVAVVKEKIFDALPIKNNYEVNDFHQTDYDPRVDQRRGRFNLILKTNNNTEKIIDKNVIDFIVKWQNRRSGSYFVEIITP